MCEDDDDDDVKEGFRVGGRTFPRQSYSIISSGFTRREAAAAKIVHACDRRPGEKRLTVRACVCVCALLRAALCCWVPK